MKRICVDVGGTFTDCLVLDLENGKFEQFKAASTRDDPSRGFIAALALAAEFYGQTTEDLLGEVELLIHGTTLATNTVLTGTGARTGMITTAGFRDSVEMRRGLRDPRNPMYNVFISPYEPLVPRYLRIGVTERLDNEGRIVEALDEAEVREAASKLREQGVESVDPSAVGGRLGVRVCVSPWPLAGSTPARRVRIDPCYTTHSGSKRRQPAERFMGSRTLSPDCNPCPQAPRTVTVLLTWTD